MGEGPLSSNTTKGSDDSSASSRLGLEFDEFPEQDAICGWRSSLQLPHCVERRSKPHIGHSDEPGATEARRRRGGASIFPVSLAGFRANGRWQDHFESQSSKTVTKTLLVSLTMHDGPGKGMEVESHH